jgi:hypothetical protein
LITGPQSRAVEANNRQLGQYPLPLNPLPLKRPGHGFAGLGRRSEAGSALRRVPASGEVTSRFRVVGSSWFGRGGGLYGLGDNDRTGQLRGREVVRVAGLVDVQDAVADVQVLHGGAAQ